MGLLSLGTPFDWEEVKPHADFIRSQGIKQFLNIWNKVKTRRMDNLLWGEEVEYVVIKFNEREKTARLCLGAESVLLKMQELEENAIRVGSTVDSSWKPEYAKYMLEGTPGQPYGATLDDLLLVEDNMIKRRAMASSFLEPGEFLIAITSFPMLGTDTSFDPYYEPTPDAGASRSLFIPQEAINSHARFSTLTANIRQRRGEKVSINLPIFQDQNTPQPFRESLPKSVVRMLTKQNLPIPKDLPAYEPAALENHVYMDAMCFGMGCCCLQVTIQACTLEAGRRLYDHLTVLTPIMLSLSASAPIFRGYLVDVDARWEVISGSVDDRTKQERGLEPLTTSKYYIPKSRYGSVSRYLSPGPNVSGCCNTVPDFEKEVCGAEFFKPEYNDLQEVYNCEVYQELIDAGVDDLLAKHYAHLFIRDPLVVFKEMLNIDNSKSSDHFENIQSTNWQTMRFKPPPPNSDIGWRVEFRSMDIQLTDHENAAYSVFIVLLVRTIQYFNLNFYIPLSKVDDNMNSARKRNAAVEEKFWFRKDIQNLDEFTNISDEHELMTTNEIMNGKGSMPGVCTLIDQYLDESEISDSTRYILKSHVNMIRQRSTGERITGAAWIRNFVRTHPSYKFDSIVTPEINYDLMKALKNLKSDDLLI